MIRRAGSITAILAATAALLSSATLSGSVFASVASAAANPSPTQNSIWLSPPAELNADPRYTA